MELNHHIARLLHQHNCVVVPDFGGFVANYRSAVIDELRQKIYPPSKSVLFNAQLTDNDGLLGNYVAKQEQLDYSGALNYIANSVSDWRKELKAGGRVEIEEIGFLYEENGNIHFEQSREINLLMQAYGLRSVDFVRFTSEKVQQKEQPQMDKPVVTETKREEVSVVTKAIVEEKKEVVSETVPVKKDAVIVLDATQTIQDITPANDVAQDVIPLRKKSRARTIVRYAAAVLFVPVLFYSYWIPMETDFMETKMIHFSDFNPIHQQSKKTYKKRDQETIFYDQNDHASWEELTANIDASVYNYELAEDFYVPIKLNNNSEVVADDNTATAQVASTGNYHVIVGCFSVKGNAQNLVDDLISKGYSAAILDRSKGLHRVTAGGYGTRDAANSAKDQLSSTGQSSWILKK